MSTNYIQPGDVLELTAPTGGVTRGAGVLIGDILVIPMDSAAVGEKFRGKTTGVFSHAKAASQAWTEGAIVYWDNTAKNFTTTATANRRAGVAVEAVAGGAGDTTGKVRLDGIALGGAAV
jgi:predicted RecA/RadA family phage recombinase